MPQTNHYSENPVNAGHALARDLQSHNPIRQLSRISGVDLIILFSVVTGTQSNWWLIQIL